MRTTKPVSTISFNSKEYLKQKLDELVKGKRISFYAFITHKPEDDEGGKKEHHHVYFEPSKMIQTDDVKEELKEFDPEKPDKPKGCITFVSSKFDTWYLYALHNKLYLAQKGQSRKYHYSDKEMITSDQEDLTFHVKSIDLLQVSPYSSMQDALDRGLQFSEFFATGVIPIPQVRNYEIAWRLLLEDKTIRDIKNMDENLGEYKHIGEE